MKWIVIPANCILRVVLICIAIGCAVMALAEFCGWKPTPASKAACNPANHEAG